MNLACIIVVAVFMLAMGLLAFAPLIQNWKRNRRIPRNGYLSADGVTWTYVPRDAGEWFAEKWEANKDHLTVREIELPDARR